MIRKIKELVVKRLLISVLLSLSVSCASDPKTHFDLESLTPKEKTDFAEAKVILLGEQHDNPLHHQIQTEILDTLGRQGRLKSVIFEQVDWEYQGALTQTNPNNVEKLGARLNWATSGWPAWEMYAPIFKTATRYRAKLIAGGLPKNRVQALYKNSYEIAFSAAEIERLKLRTPLDESAWALMRTEIYEGHCKMIPEDHTEKMLPVQRARDGALIKGYLREADISGVTVFILGNGHARKEFGVPTLLKNLDPKLKIWSVGMQEVGSTPFPPQAFDKVWVTQAAEREDPCEAMKKHMEGKATKPTVEGEEGKPEVSPTIPSTEPNSESPASDVQDSPAEEKSEEN